MAARPIAIPAGFDVSKRDSARGGQIFRRACGECHYNTFGGYPDLRRMSASTHELFKEIVLRGIYAAKGMGRFDDSLNEEDADDIHAYLIGLAQQELHGKLPDSEFVPCEKLNH